MMKIMVHWGILIGWLVGGFFCFQSNLFSKYALILVLVFLSSVAVHLYFIGPDNEISEEIES